MDLLTPDFLEIAATFGKGIAIVFALLLVGSLCRIAAKPAPRIGDTDE